MPHGPEFRAVQTFSRVAGRLPWGAGHYRLASRYASRQRWVAGSYTEQRLRSGARVRLDLGDRTQCIAFLVRDYSPALTRYIVSRLPREGILFDVGGNVGLISFSVASIRPDVAIHAFEPSRINAEAWRHNQQLNRADSLVLAEVAASDRVGRAEFTIPSDSASGTIRPGGNESVPTTTLDRYCQDHGISHIDVLKIDVEGHEPSVLRGATRLLAAGAIGTILCEVLNVSREEPESVQDMLGRHSYRAARIPAVGMRRLVPGSRGSADDVAFELDEAEAP